jgi:diguanylate cyclase (GGDEF)-like protein
MSFLPSRYDPTMVIASVLIGSFASYVALDLAKRALTRGRVAVIWWACGSVAMGTGIWSMHFVGMLAFSVPIALGYTKLLTFLSWLAGVAVSAVALAVASGGSLSARRLGAGSLLMGTGICAMHYIGMAALAIVPGIVWNPWLIGASAAIAVGASAAALLIFFWLRVAGTRRGWLYQVVAAVVMGLAISGMHYTGMAAANFPYGAVCLSANSLAGNDLGKLVVVTSLALLLLTLGSSILDANLRLARSLHAANTQLNSANEALRKQAFIEPLTGLPNRALLNDRLLHAVARYERAGAANAEKLAILLLDLDGFKPVNDSFGHTAGDLVLKEAAGRLSAVVRHGDTLARLGGDEFVLLTEGVGSAADCLPVAQRMLAALRQPFDVHGQQVSIGGSVGIVVYPDHGDLDKLLSHADTAMYTAKRSGGNSHAVFEPHMDAHAQQQLTVRNELRQAIESDQFFVEYQPIVELAGGRTIGLEALARWRHPQRGLVPPGQFIPLAERCGLIDALGEKVLRLVAAQLHEWSIDLVPLVPISINVSPRQLERGQIDKLIGTVTEQFSLDPSLVQVEITESALMHSTKQNLATLQALRALGIKILIDDFGTGYSSLNYIKQMPIDCLKIDGSFVRGIGSDPRDTAIIRAIMSIAHSLDMSVIAEGVESAQQAKQLVEFGCSAAQGFYFHRPMTAAHCRSLLGQLGERQTWTDTLRLRMLRLVSGESPTGK